MLSTLLYGAEEYGPEESVHIQLCVQDFIGEISIAWKYYFHRAPKINVIHDMIMRETVVPNNRK